MFSYDGELAWLRLKPKAKPKAKAKAKPKTATVHKTATPPF